jgi:hypothetical protein
MRRVILLMGGLILFLMVLGSSVAYASSFLLNGGAEDAVLSPWIGDYGAVTTANGFNPQDGAYFFYKNGTGLQISQEGTNGLIAGETFILDGWCATDGVDYGTATLSFYDTNGVLMNSVSTSAPLKGASREWVSFNISLVVPDGAYSWEVTLDSNYGGSGSYRDVFWDSISLSSNNVPIPGAVWLLGSGLIGLVGIRRKFRKS